MNTPTRRFASLALAALLTAASSVALAGANASITNGNLDLQTYYLRPNQFLPQSPAPDSWSLITAGGEAWQDYGSTPSPAGGKYWGVQYLSGWDQPGYDPRYNAGGIYQSISGLTIGQTYAVSFYSMANHTNDASASEYWKVTFGSSVLNGSSVDAAQKGVWKQDTLNFVATAATQTLKFTAIFANATPGVSPEMLNLDGISISAVPEPSETALLLAGLVAMGFIVRRRKAG